VVCRGRSGSPPESAGRAGVVWRCWSEKAALSCRHFPRGRGCSKTCADGRVFSSGFGVANKRFTGPICLRAGVGPIPLPGTLAESFGTADFGSAARGWFGGSKRADSRRGAGLIGGGFTSQDSVGGRTLLAPRRIRRFRTGVDDRRGLAEGGFAKASVAFRSSTTTACARIERGGPLRLRAARRGRPETQGPGHSAGIGTTGPEGGAPDHRPCFDGRPRAQAGSPARPGRGVRRRARIPFLPDLPEGRLGLDGPSLPANGHEGAHSRELASLVGSRPSVRNGTYGSTCWRCSTGVS